MKRALIFDLDNTIYPVSSIAENLFSELFAILDENAEQLNYNVDSIKQEMMRRPFQYIADKFELNESLRDQMVESLRNMSYDLPMQPFEDYEHLRQIPLDKFLVTTGFSKLQWSKV